jgi:hypothetical protein
MFFFAFFPVFVGSKNHDDTQRNLSLLSARLADFFCPDPDGVFFSSSRWEHKNK